MSVMFTIFCRGSISTLVQKWLDEVVYNGGQIFTFRFRNKNLEWSTRLYHVIRPGLTPYIGKVGAVGGTKEYRHRTSRERIFITESY